MNRALVSILLLAGCAHDRHAEGRDAHHRFDDAEAWAAAFEDPQRDAWQKPDDVLKALALPPDAAVADLGSATGYFSVRLSKALPQGQVYGVDIETSMRDYLKKRASEEGLQNLTAVLGAPDDPKLPGPVDLVLVVDTYHHIQGRTAYFEKLAASLKPGARVAIVDFRQASAMGPKEKLAPGTVEVELVHAGYKKVASFDFLPEQYFLVFGR